MAGSTLEMHPFAFYPSSGDSTSEYDHNITNQAKFVSGIGYHTAGL